MLQVNVTLITEVVSEDGTKIKYAFTSGATTTPHELVTRVAHREAERAADETREALQPRYGELDPQWRKQ